MAAIELEGSIDPSELAAHSSIDFLGEDHIHRMIKRYPELSLPELFDILSAFAPIIVSARIHTYLPVLFEGRVKNKLLEKRSLNGGSTPQNVVVFSASLLHQP